MVVCEVSPFPAVPEADVYSICFSRYPDVTFRVLVYIIYEFVVEAVYLRKFSGIGIKCAQS